MARRSSLSDKEREELIAFLDGELEEEAARALEARLAHDPEIRAEAESLKRTWDLLDYLPRPEPSPSFTNATLDRLSARETQAALRPRPWKRWALAGGWAAALLLAAGLGYLAGRKLAPPPALDPDEELIRNLNLVENLRYYRHVPDLGFLRDLERTELFGEETP